MNKEEEIIKEKKSSYNKIKDVQKEANVLLDKANLIKIPKTK
jgi:hypothetical protein